MEIVALTVLMSLKGIESVAVRLNRCCLFIANVGCDRMVVLLLRILCEQKFVFIAAGKDVAI